MECSTLCLGYHLRKGEVGDLRLGAWVDGWMYVCVFSTGNHEPSPVPAERHSEGDQDEGHLHARSNHVNTNAGVLSMHAKRRFSVTAPKVMSIAKDEIANKHAVGTGYQGNRLLVQNIYS